MNFYTQYLETKKQYPDHIIFVRIGDFYETFGDDAKTVSEALGLILCSRLVGTGAEKVRVKMAGVPYFTIQGHVASLVEQEHKVALADPTAQEQKQ